MVLVVCANADMFSKGNIGIGVALGAGTLTVNDEVQTYTLAGASANYFVIDNLSVGVDYLGWFGPEPTMDQVTLPLNYYFKIDEDYRPYTGVFFRNTFVSGAYDDFTSYGVRAGVAMMISSRAYLAFGVVQEYYESSAWRDETSQTYPELTFAFSF